MRILVVRSAFGDYRRGDEIADPQVMEAILAGEHAQHITVTERETATPASAASEIASSAGAPALDKPRKTSK
jgi:hypothetical protein